MRPAHSPYSPRAQHVIKMTNQCKLNHDMPVRLPQKAAAQVPCGAAACSKTSARPAVAPLEPRRVTSGVALRLPP